MTRNGYCRLAPLVLAMLVVAMSAQAQATSQLGVTIDHPFTAGDKEMPAGRYIIERSNANPPILIVRGETGSARSLVPVVTRLAQDEIAPTDPRIVFDQVGEKYFLSEVWMAGQDGFLLQGAKEEHKHAIARVAK